MNLRKLITRKQIIEFWNQSDESVLNKLCCPDCRDILLNDLIVNEEKAWVCNNAYCSNNSVYVKHEGEDHKILSDKYIDKLILTIKDK